MNLDQRIAVERDRVAGDIQKLNEENKTDSDLLNDLKQEYNAAIFSLEAEKIDSVNERIKTVNDRIKIRKDKIEALENDNPLIQSIVVKEVEQWMNEAEILEEQAESLFKELQPKRKKLLDGLSELDNIKNRINSLSYSINYFNEQYMNDQTRNKLGLTKVRISPLDNPATKIMNSLLIENKDVFKRS
ncbi:hypothetical protein [Jeotgalibacillus soli]|uniref:Uncharacterized protein n=1 Tax=Jeotgalibacillus soli TaxID=889306 RepID=A0A0C2VKQ2_9BACL|nr:hypothetical protein [Jeotgalibacillus soli]KIL45006.1 hypothetical protein KP78_25500 [Jeotgalibacillus soli]